MRKETKIKNNFSLLRPRPALTKLQRGERIRPWRKISDFRLQKGFTLVEMLAVIFIISLLSTLLIANYRRSQKQYALEQAAQKLVSDLRRVQAMAMSGEGIEGTYNGYGIYLKKEADEEDYIIYGDSDGDDCLYDKTGTNKDTKVEIGNFPANITAKTISPLLTGVDVAPNQKNTLHICFVPPDPTLYINRIHDLQTMSDATIMLQYGDDDSLTRTITVTKGGAIKAE